MYVEFMRYENFLLHIEGEKFLNTKHIIPIKSSYFSLTFPLLKQIWICSSHFQFFFKLFKCLPDMSVIFLKGLRTNLYLKRIILSRNAIFVNPFSWLVFRREYQKLWKLILKRWNMLISTKSGSKFRICGLRKFKRS